MSICQPFFYIFVFLNELEALKIVKWSNIVFFQIDTFPYSLIIQVTFLVSLDLYGSFQSSLSTIRFFSDI